jgi:hypothetical protein
VEGADGPDVVEAVTTDGGRSGRCCRRRPRMPCQPPPGSRHLGPPSLDPPLPPAAPRSHPDPGTCRARHRATNPSPCTPSCARHFADTAAQAQHPRPRARPCQATQRASVIAASTAGRDSHRSTKARGRQVTRGGRGIPARSASNAPHGGSRALRGHAGGPPDAAHPIPPVSHPQCQPSSDSPGPQCKPDEPSQLQLLCFARRVVVQQAATAVSPRSAAGSHWRSDTRGNET